MRVTLGGQGYKSIVSVSPQLTYKMSFQGYFRASATLAYHRYEDPND